MTQDYKSKPYRVASSLFLTGNFSYSLKIFLDRQLYGRAFLI